MKEFPLQLPFEGLLRCKNIWKLPPIWQVFKKHEQFLQLFSVKSKTNNIFVNIFTEFSKRGYVQACCARFPVFSWDFRVYEFPQLGRVLLVQVNQLRWLILWDILPGLNVSLYLWDVLYPIRPSQPLFKGKEQCDKLFGKFGNNGKSDPLCKFWLRALMEGMSKHILGVYTAISHGYTWRLIFTSIILGDYMKFTS